MMSDGHCRLVLGAVLITWQAAFGLSPHGFAAESPVKRESKLLSSVDLNKNPDWCGKPCALYAKIDFTDSDTVVVVYTDSTQKRDPEDLHWDREPGFLKALFLEAASGQRRAELKWPVEHLVPNALLPVHDGGFLIATNGRLLRYTPERLISGALLISLPNAQNFRPRFYATPGGHKLFMHADADSAKSGETVFVESWIDVDRLEKSSPESVNGQATTSQNVHDKPYFTLLSAAEDGVLSTKPQAEALRHVLNGEDWRLHHELWFRGREGQADWKHFCPTISSNTLTEPDMFLEGDKVLLSANRTFFVVNRSCEVLFTGPLGWGMNHWVESHRSMKGNRFTIEETDAFMQNIFRPPNFLHRLTVSVYDVESRSRVFKKAFGRHDTREISVALSPDGTRLAVLIESQLQVFQLSPT